MRSVTLLLCLAFVAAACSAVPGGVPTATPSQAPVGGYPGWPPNVASDLTPIMASSELVVGPNRLVFTIVTKQNEPLATADRPVQVKLYNLAADPATPAVDTPATFLPTIEGAPGLYHASVDFSATGPWGLETVTTEPDGSHRSGRMQFDVLDKGSTPAIGAQAPSSPTPTATTADGIAHISTDSAPDPDFYKVSESDALSQHKPFVITFATPAFCRTAMCGPTLNIVKGVAAEYKDKLTFIHVEPYKLTYSNGQLQPVLSAQNLPISVDATNIWGLPTEPYTFVVAANGKITAKFEGIVAPDELKAAFDADS